MEIINKFHNHTVQRLKKEFTTLIEGSCRYKPEVKREAIGMLNTILNRIYRKKKSMYNYCVDDTTNPREPLIFSARNEQCSLIYRIFEDCSSSAEFIIHSSFKTELPPTFFTNRAKKKNGVVYFIKSQFGYKIGCTARLKKRIGELGILLPFATILHSIIPTSDYVVLESDLHELLSHKNINGEWFNLSDEDFYDIDKYVANRRLERICDPLEIEKFKSSETNAT